MSRRLAFIAHRSSLITLIMSEPCKTCGSELFAGQRFCRACGNPTDTLDAGEAPTQQFVEGVAPPGEATTRHMPPPPDDWSARGGAHTAPQSRPNTNPVSRPPDAYQPPQAYQAPPTSYQLPPQPLTWQPPQYPPQPPPAPTRSGSSWAIVLAIILALMLGAIIGGRAIYRRVRDNIRANIQQASQQSAPVSSTDKKVFALNAGATVTIKTVNGSIKITGWDEPRAEVQIIKKNSSDSPPVTIRSDEKSLYVEAPPDGRGGQVSFEVKLPRDLGAVTLNSINGGITLKEVDGQISVETVNGGINFDDVSGVERARTVNGGIEAVLSQPPKDHPMTFETANGGIKLTIDDGFNATLDAATVHGRIDVDEEFDGIKTEKKVPFGATASGNLGTGGPALKVTTTNGSIKINK
jgi:Putative adhesin